MPKGWKLNLSGVSVVLSHSIELETFACPKFKDGKDYVVQQGAGMVVLKSEEKEQQAAVEFLDNGGGVGEEGCDYCQGPRDPESSDNPEKAIISLVNDRKTEYGTYISVQNELVAAYNVLRNQTAQRLYGKCGLYILIRLI